MLKFRTKKKVQTSLHDESTNLIEFRFTYSRENYGMYVKCDAYRIDTSDNGDDSFELIPAGGSYRKIKEELQTLMTSAIAITPVDENPLEYMDSLVTSGIKLIIVSEGLWKNSLTMKDFE